MKHFDSYSGINIQFPISRLIMDGSKTIETRTYPIPAKYIGVPMILIETPGAAGSFKARMIGLITFGKSFRYTSKTAFYGDTSRHCVTPTSIWAWDEDKEKWGWPILDIFAFAEVLPLQKRAGIKFSSGIKIERTSAYRKEM